MPLQVFNSFQEYIQVKSPDQEKRTGYEGGDPSKPIFKIFRHAQRSEDDLFYKYHPITKLLDKSKKYNSTHAWIIDTYIILFKHQGDHPYADYLKATYPAVAAVAAGLTPVDFETVVFFYASKQYYRATDTRIGLWNGRYEDNLNDPQFHLGTWAYYLFVHTPTDTIIFNASDLHICVPNSGAQALTNYQFVYNNLHLKTA